MERKNVPGNTGNTYSQKIADKLKNMYGGRMQNMNEPIQETQKTAQKDSTESQENSPETDALRDQLARMEAERNEYKELSIRKVAELENFRRRTQQEKAELSTYANQKLLLSLLPIVDDLQRAIELGKKGNDYKALLEGIEMVYNKALQTFQEAGVQPMEVLGDQFDLNLHESLMHMPSEAPEGEIVQEVQRGYMYKDKVLRHAKVITSAGT